MSYTTQRILVSPQGMVRLHQQLERLQADYDRIRDERKIAHELSGDGWHDNPEFNRLQQMEANRNHEILRIRKLIADAREFIPQPVRPTEKVRLSSVVLIGIQDGDNYREEWWEIAPYNDTDLAARLLGYETPLASLLIGTEPGEVFHYEGREYEVIELASSPDALATHSNT